MLPFLRLLFICRWHKPTATAIVSFVTFKIYVSMCPTIIHHYSTFHFVILECFYLVSSRYHFCLSRWFEFIHTCSECFFFTSMALCIPNIKTRYHRKGRNSPTCLCMSLTMRNYSAHHSSPTACLFTTICSSALLSWFYVFFLMCTIISAIDLN